MELKQQLIEVNILIEEAESEMMKAFWRRTRGEIIAQIAVEQPELLDQDELNYARTTTAQVPGEDGEPF